MSFSGFHFNIAGFGRVSVRRLYRIVDSVWSIVFFHLLIIWSKIERTTRTRRFILEIGTNKFNWSNFISKKTYTSYYQLSNNACCHNVDRCLHSDTWQLMDCWLVACTNRPRWCGGLGDLTTASSLWHAVRDWGSTSKAWLSQNWPEPLSSTRGHKIWVPEHPSIKVAIACRCIIDGCRVSYCPSVKPGWQND